MIRTALLGLLALGLPAVATAASLAPAAPDAFVAATDAFEVRRAADGLFYVDATVNGARVRFLVDTGANYTILTRADAVRLGLSPAAARYNAAVETVGGRAAMAWTTLAEVRVAGRQLKGLRAAVVQGGLDVSLLGQNMLSHLDQVTIERDRLTMR